MTNAKHTKSTQAFDMSLYPTVELLVYRDLETGTLVCTPAGEEFFRKTRHKRNSCELKKD